MDHLCYLCLVFVMLSRLFIAAFWSPAGKGLTSWHLFEMFNCVFVTFQNGFLGQMWYLIVSISDLYHLSYFNCFIFSNRKDSTKRIKFCLRILLSFHSNHRKFFLKKFKCSVKM